MLFVKPYKSKNYNNANTSLTKKLPLLTDLNSYSYLNSNTKSKTKSTSEITNIKNINLNIKNSSFSQNSKKILSKRSQLSYVFKKPKEKIKNKFVWPKITHPKLPFSKREKIPEEERKKRIREQKPNRLYHNFYTIKWLRKKYSDSLIERSVFSMLPDNGKPVVPDDESEREKKHRLLMEYVDSLYKRVPEREKNVNINPKYFFDQKTFEKILKFKEIFLEFDEDQSRKMEIDEMVEMFNQNHIEASLEDLKNLFFKEKKVKKEDIMKLYLDFYQFMNFALAKDQDFREFMREIKAKRKKNEKGAANWEKSKDKEENEDEDDGYLPMNFNLMFDYFLMKGKERASIEEIEKSMNEMDKIIKGSKKNENEGGENNPEEKEKIKFDRRTSSASFFNFIDINNLNVDIKKINLDYEEQLKNLNFVNLIDNFITLFHINESHNNAMSESFMELVENHEQNSGRKNIKTKDDNNIKTNIFTEKDIEIDEPKNQSEEKQLLSPTSLNENTFEKLVKYDINKKIIKNLNMNNYNKYHDINLALTETKKEVNSFIKTQKNKNQRKNNNLPINDNSIININSNSKENYFFNNKIKERSLKINPLYVFDKTKNHISMNYSKSVKINSSLNSKDLNNNNNQNMKYNQKSEITSINSYMSGGNNKNKKTKKVDFVPQELLKENKRRYFRFFI